MKQDVSRNGDAFGYFVSYPVCFAFVRIAKKQAWMTLRVELLAFFLGHMYECFTAEDAGMSERQLDPKPCFIRCRIWPQTCISMVQYVGRCLNGLAPEIQGYITMVKHAASCFH